MPSEAAEQFRKSMIMNFDMWHDGTGYDLAALAKVTGDDLRAIEETLRTHQPLDWRDVEALARIDSPTARAAVLEAAKSSDPAIRREAMNYVPVDPGERERHLVDALRSAALMGGLSAAIDEAAEFHPPAVVEELLRGVLHREGPVAIHFAALLYFIHGKADEPFDWNHRPFFLQFDTQKLAERIALFRQLCETIGVSPASYLQDERLK